MKEYDIFIALSMAIEVSTTTEYTAILRYGPSDIVNLKLFNFMSNKYKEFVAVNEEDLDKMIIFMKELLESEKSEPVL